MPARVAVDDELGQVRQALVAEGFDVVDLEQNISTADIVVLSGLTENTVGYSDIRTGAAVVNAGGMTADDVVQEVRARLARRT